MDEIWDREKIANILSDPNIYKFKTQFIVDGKPDLRAIEKAVILTGYVNNIKMTDEFFVDREFWKANAQHILSIHEEDERKYRDGIK